MHNENFSPSPKAYGRGHTFVKQMGYPRHGPLSQRLDARVEPLDHALFGCNSKKMVGLGFENDNKKTNPILDESNSEDELKYMPNLTNQQDMCEDWVPSTNLLQGDSDNPVTHAIGSNLEQDESSVEDPLKEHQYKNGV